MAGVNIGHMLIFLYRTHIKIKRWYLKALFHYVDVAKVNGWLLYRQHCNQLGIVKPKRLSLLRFTMAIASALIHSRAIITGVGQPPKRKSNSGSNARKASAVPSPVADVRFDQVSHWPQRKPSNCKCRLCKIGQNRVYCMKCQAGAYLGGGPWPNGSPPKYPLGRQDNIFCINSM